MYYDAKTKSLVLSVDDPLAVRELIPRSRILDHPQFNMAVQYTDTSARLLRNLGIPIPAPIQLTYDWPGKYTPWSHQREMSEVMTRYQRVFNLSDMGTGKSAATLWAADYLMRTKVIKKALIISPLSTLERVWMHDVFDILMHRSAVVVHGTREQRLDALKHDVDFYILNHDGLSIPPVAEAIRRHPDIGLVVIDEASKFRNHDTRKYKALVKMLRPDMRLWLLTATPCPNNPTDAWALARLVSPQRVPQFFGAFKRQTMAQVSTFKWVAKPDAYVHAFNAMQPAVRFEKSQCLDLPPVTYKERQAGLTAEQREAYEAMRKTMQIEAKETQITAVNAADRLTKLRQILCGAVKDPATDAYVVLPHEPRLNALLDVIAEAKAKVIVVVPFKGILQSLATEVGAHYSVAVMNGDVSINQRNRIITAFKSGPEPRVLLCHPEVMSHGLNLTEADVTVFYAPIYSNDQFQQVTERMNRAGQVNKMTVVKIGAMPLEWEIYRSLDGSQKQQTSTLDLYKMALAEITPTT